MTKIHEEQTHRTTDHGKVQYVTEASQLGLKPGEWPSELVLILHDSGYHGPITFAKSRNVVNDELVAVVYIEHQTGDYMELHVLND